MKRAGLWLRLRALFFRARVERELEEELDFHLEMQVRKHVRQGLTPAEAKRRALARFGRPALVAEACRDVRRSSLVDQFWQDVRYALRISGRNPGFAGIAILTLALGIGCTTAIFSVVHAVLLRSLPYPDADRVVRIVEQAPPRESSNTAPPRVSPLAVSNLAALRSQTRTLSHVGVHLPAIRTLTGRGDPVRLVGARMSPDIFPMLDARPLIGRTFASHEDTASADPVVVLSHATWQRQFAGDPAALGQSVSLDRQPHVVVGVMPPGFAFPDPRDEFWIPFVVEPSDTRRLPITGRVRDGATTAAAAAELSAIVLQGDPPAAASAQTPRIRLVPLLDLVVAPVKPALRVLAAAVGFVLLIACVNVANLLLARTAARRREIAVRRALGASRGRLIRQVLTESVMLALAGGIAGIGLAVGGIRLLRILASTLPRRDLGPVASIPRLDEIGVDASVLAFSVVASILTGVLFGLAPALRQSVAQPMDVLREGAGSATAGFNLFRRHRLQGLLVVAEITMAIVLFVGGALLIYSFVNISKVNLGYDPHGVLTFQVSLPGQGLDQELREFSDRLIERVRSLPDVRAAGYVESLPMTRVSGRFVPLRTTPGVAGRPRRPPPGAALPPDTPDMQFVSRDFLAAMGIRVAEGRAFGENDRAGQPPVMLINRTLARSGLLGAHPIGRSIYAYGDDPWEIVGIVEDIRQSNPARLPEPQIFIDFRQVPASQPVSGVGLYFGIRTDGESTTLSSSIRGLVRQLDARAIVDNVAPMEELVSNAIARPRLYAVLLGIFAGVAVVLAGIGIYGVMACAVAQRTREIGIRIALGARRSQVMALVLGQSLILVGVGVTLGLSGAVATTRYLEEMLFGLTPLDPVTFLAVSLVFALVAIVASYVPARRATTVDPLVTLRYE